MNFYRNCKSLLIFFAVILIGFFSFAQETKALTITPARFEVKGNPGETLTYEILLINENDSAETLYPSFANFEAQGDSGSPAFTEPKEGLGTWMSADMSSVYLAPRQQRIVPFKIKIPQNAEPGGYFAVIFWGTSPPSSPGVTIGAKTGVLVLLSVNGEVKEEAGLLNFNTAGERFFYKTLPVSFEYRLRNDGGDRIKPSGVIKVRNTLFLPSEKLDANPVEGNVLPNSTRKFTIDWVEYQRSLEYVSPSGIFAKFWSEVVYQWKNFAVGLYSASLNIDYGTQGANARGMTFFFVFPWQLLVVLFLVFIIVFWGGRKLIRRYNRYIIEKARAGMKLPPDSSHG